MRNQFEMSNCWDLQLCFSVVGWLQYKHHDPFCVSVCVHCYTVYIQYYCYDISQYFSVFWAIPFWAHSFSHDLESALWQSSPVAGKKHMINMRIGKSPRICKGVRLFNLQRVAIHLIPCRNIYKCFSVRGSWSCWSKNPNIFTDLAFPTPFLLAPRRSGNSESSSATSDLNQNHLSQSKPLSWLENLPLIFDDFGYSTWGFQVARPC